MKIFDFEGQMGLKNINLISCGIKSTSTSIYDTVPTHLDNWSNIDCVGLVGAIVFSEVKRGAIMALRKKKSIWYR